MDDDRPGARVTLPPIDEVEVPSIILIERAYQRSLHDVICRKDMFRIWQKVGAACAATMLQGKGVRFPGIADLTFDVKGLPMYSLERDMNVLLKQFGSGHGVRWESAHKFFPCREASLLATLPLESVAKSLNARRAKKDKARRAAGVVEPPNKHKRTFDRAVVGMVVHRIFSEMIRAARMSTISLALTLDDVGEFVYYSGPSGDGLGARGYLGVRFRLDFLAALRRTRAREMIEHPRTRRAASDRDGMPYVREFLDPSVVEPKKLLAAPGMGELSPRIARALAPSRSGRRAEKPRHVRRARLTRCRTSRRRARAGACS